MIILAIILVIIGIVEIYIIDCIKNKNIQNYIYEINKYDSIIELILLTDSFLKIICGFVLIYLL